MAYDMEMIPREQFTNMIQHNKVVRFPDGHGGIIHEVKNLLDNNAMTAEAMADKLRIDRKTILNAINHLRNRYGLKITRYYNLRDRKYYYYLGSTNGEQLSRS